MLFYNSLLISYERFIGRAVNTSDKAIRRTEKLDKLTVKQLNAPLVALFVFTDEAFVNFLAVSLEFNVATLGDKL